jgi:chaperonin cofactor prefoldin
MKQQSKAEEALKKQLEWINNQIEGLIQQQASIQHKVNTLREVQTHTTRTMSELRSARMRASERNKPGNPVE